MRVLVLLAERRGQVVTRSDLEYRVWPRMLVTDEAVTNTLIKLRKALGDDARNPTYIETIAKSGYRLIAEVAPLEEMTREAPRAEMPVLVATPPAVAGQVADAAEESPAQAETPPSSSWRKSALVALVVVLGLIWLLTRQFQTLAGNA